jgi:hypothetical protein
MAKAKETKQTIIPVELTGMVNVLGTEKTKHMKTGQVYTVTSTLAKKLIAKGAELIEK